MVWRRRGIGINIQNWPGALIVRIVNGNSKRFHLRNIIEFLMFDWWIRVYVSPLPKYLMLALLLLLLLFSSFFFLFLVQLAQYISCDNDKNATIISLYVCAIDFFLCVPTNELTELDKQQ